MNNGAFDLPRPDILRWLNPRQVDLLRLLGRLEMMSSAQIYQMLYAGTLTRRAMQRQLAQLWVDGLIWRNTVRYGALPGKTHGPPMKYPYVYGLTPEGKTLLDTLGVEHDQRSLDGLRCRDPRGRRIAAPTLAHDLMVSWWCSSILMAVRDHPLCHEVFLQTEFTVHERQRLDALVVLRLNPKRLRQPTGAIPWFEGRPCPPEAIEVRLGLEVDMGTEALSILAGKAHVSRELHTSGLYDSLFGGPIRTVFLAPTRRRAAQIASEWRNVWPETWACIATISSCEHPTHGSLFGDYRLLTDGTQPAPLLAEFATGNDRRVRVHRALALDEWNAYLGDVTRNA